MLGLPFNPGLSLEDNHRGESDLSLWVQNHTTIRRAIVAFLGS